MSSTTSYNSERKVQSLDEILARFNIFGRYHGLCMTLIIFAYMQNSMQVVNYVFIAQEVKYRCAANTTLNGWNVSEPCTDWTYDRPDSFVAEFNLAGQDWKRTLVGSAHSFGFMIGTLVIGPLSDRIGRKPATIISGVAAGVVGVAKAFAPWYWFYITLEVIGAAVGGFNSPVFMIGVESVSTKQRIPFTVITGVGYCLGGILMALAAWLVPYWRTCLTVIYAPTLIFLCFIALLDESPRWLLSVGKNKKATEIITKISRWNNVDIDKYQLQNIDVIKNEDMSFANLLKNTLLSKQLLKRFCICVLWWIACSFIHYGMILNSVFLQGNKYWNFGLMYAVDLLVTIFKIWILNYLNRKVSLISAFCMGAVLCLIQPLTPSSLPWLSITIFSMGQVMAAFMFDIIYLYTSELFPTYTRNSMHSLCSAIGRIGSVLAPQTPLLIKYWAGLPLIIFGCVALFGAMLTFFVPDTAKRSMPDTVKQAEAMDANIITDVETTPDVKSVEKEIYRLKNNNLIIFVLFTTAYRLKKKEM